MRRFRNAVLGAALLALALIAAACGGEPGEGGGGGGGGDEKPSVTVGAVAFAENQIVAEMYAQILEANGFEVDRQLTLESREILQPAIQNGEVDLAPEYLSTLLLFLDPDAEASGDPDEVRAQLEPLLEQHGQVLLESSQADDTNALVVTPETAEQYGLEITSDLAPVADQLTLGGPPECPNRPFCLPGFERVYGIEFGDFKPLDVGGPLTVEALEQGEIDVALLFSTSGVIGEKGWIILEDDKNLQNTELITPVVREDVLTDEMRDLLNEVSATLDTEKMIELNGKVETQGQDPATVAEEHLRAEGLL